MPIETAPLPQTDEEMARQLADAYVQMAHLKAGGTQKIQEKFTETSYRTKAMLLILSISFFQTQPVQKNLFKNIIPIH